MTEKNLANGTERIASIIHKIKADLVIDVHADEAILDPNNIKKLINFHKKNFSKFDLINSWQGNLLYLFIFFV